MGWLSLFAFTDNNCPVLNCSANFSDVSSPSNMVLLHV
jgi:hypothetical protein